MLRDICRNKRSCKILKFEVLAFDCEADYDAAEMEQDFKKFCVAKFANKGDAVLYAQSLLNRPQKPYLVLIRNA